MKSIKILGGGIAGLTAAINLKMAGIAVEVYEKKDGCGKHSNNFQFVENWIFNEDALDTLQNMHIQTDFYTKPRYSQEALSPSGKKYIGTSNKPVTYLLKRGKARDSIDKALESQSLQLGIKINHNSTLKAQEADIIATGIKQPTFIATGIMFSCALQDKSILLFDDNLSEKFYSYFVVNDNVGEITCVNPVGIKDHIARLENTVNRFEEILTIKVEKIIEKFSAPLNFDPLTQAHANNQYFVGEAAGFQDCFLGFGMMYAFKSGYLAAKSIIDDLDYHQLLNSEILKPIKISGANRVLFEKLSNQGYERLIKLLNSRNPIIRSLFGGNDLRQILKKQYNHSLSYFLRPLLFW
jgi:flavin-dependent dehydrogenase